MKTKFAAAAILLASTSLGFAADLAVKAPYAAPAAVWNWTGFYIGANAGGGWGTTETAATSVAGFLIPGGPIPITQNNRSGFLGGGQAGYNFQSGWAVFGVEGSIDGLDVKGTTPCLGIFGGGGGFGASCTAKSNWLATATGRIGGVVGDRTLVYVKGGAAWLNTNHTLNVLGGFGGGGGTFSTSSTSTTFGWLLGLGTEYAFDHNWSAFVEYNYIEFDKKNIDLVIPGAPGAIGIDVKNKLSVAKVGVNYKFGGPIVAKY